MFRVALDMDGVLYDWDAQVRRMLRERFGTVVGVSRSWDHVKDAVPAEEWRWLWQDEQVRRMFSEGYAYAGALEMADRLFDIADHLAIVTSGPDLAGPVKKAWLDEAGVFRDDFILVPRNSSKLGARADLYIDDSPLVAQEVVDGDPDAIVLLVCRPWNRDLARHPRIVRVYSWEDALLEAQVAA